MEESCERFDLLLLPSTNLDVRAQGVVIDASTRPSDNTAYLLYLRQRPRLVAAKAVVFL